MSAAKKQPPPEPERFTAEVALGNSIRILRWAEDETDLAKMATLTAIAEAWTNVAHLLTD